MVPLCSFCYALAMSAAVIPDPDRDTQIAALTAALAAAKAELAARDLLIETLRVQIARMRRMAFGASSEKLSAEIAQLELALEELEAAAVVTAIVSPAPICTVIETCKMNGVEPQAYIADVIAQIANDWPAARWDELMPWN
jgi:hypothetical protein